MRHTSGAYAVRPDPRLELERTADGLRPSDLRPWRVLCWCGYGVPEEHACKGDEMFVGDELYRISRAGDYRTDMRSFFASYLALSAYTSSPISESPTPRIQLSSLSASTSVSGGYQVAPRSINTSPCLAFHLIN